TPPLFSLGVVLPGLALLSAATRLALRPAGARLEALFLGLGGALGAVALLLLPEQTWLVGPISLCLAIGSTGVLRAAGWLPLSLRRVLPAALLLTTLLAALPVWFSSPPAEDFTRAINAGDIYNDDAQVRFEQQGYGIAVLPPGAAIPTTLSPDAPISRALLTGYASDNINRFSANPVLQNNAAVLFAGTHRHRFQISSPQSQTVTMLLAWYPGWQAYLDGVALPTLAAPGGLVNVALPAAAAGELTVRLDSTPARAAAWGISLLALVIISLVLLRRPRHPAAPPAYQPPPLLAAAEARILGLLLLLLGTLAWLSYQQVLPLRAAPQFALQGATLLKNRSDAGLEAYAYRLPGDTFRPGDPVTVTVYWQATAPLTENYRTRLSLRDVTSGTVWAATTPQLPGNFPPRRWSRNRYVPDTTTLPLPADLPPGRYVLAVEAFVCATTTTCPLSTRPGFFAGNGNPVGPALPLRVITVQAAP
nr:hypothetical protein [Anaerolineae bacterium]